MKREKKAEYVEQGKGESALFEEGQVLPASSPHPVFKLAPMAALGRRLSEKDTFPFGIPF